MIIANFHNLKRFMGGKFVYQIWLRYANSQIKLKNVRVGNPVIINYDVTVDGIFIRESCRWIANYTQFLDKVDYILIS